MSRKYGLILTAIILSAGIANAAPNYSTQQHTPAPSFQQNYYPTQTLSGNQTLKGSVVTVPAGQKVLHTAEGSSWKAFCQTDPD